jgi:hypothetical protein
VKIKNLLIWLLIFAVFGCKEDEGIEKNPVLPISGESVGDSTDNINGRSLFRLGSTDTRIVGITWGLNKDNYWYMEGHYFYPGLLDQLIVNFPLTAPPMNSRTYVLQSDCTDLSSGKACVEYIRTNGEAFPITSQHYYSREGQWLEVVVSQGQVSITLIQITMDGPSTIQLSSHLTCN